MKYCMAKLRLGLFLLLYLPKLGTWLEASLLKRLKGDSYELDASDLLEVVEMARTEVAASWVRWGRARSIEREAIVSGFAFAVLPDVEGLTGGCWRVVVNLLL